MKTKKILTDESNTELMDGFTITNYNSPDEIRTISQKLYDFCVVAYSKIEGGFLTARNAKDIEKKVKLASVVSKDDNILACLLYETRLGGLKATAGGAIPGNTESKNALQSIICRDIANSDSNYWVEASGVIEHYFKKHKGSPIPNTYAPALLRKPNIMLEEDKYHYSRKIGLPDEEGNVKVDTKCIFGFQSQELLKRIMCEFEDYASFREYVIGDDKVPTNGEVKESGYVNLYRESGLTDQINAAIGYVGYIEEMVYENNTNLIGMTPDMYSMLGKAVSILRDGKKSAPDKYLDQIIANVEMGENLLSETYPIKIHSFGRE